jgi:hypothetical protein
MAFPFFRSSRSKRSVTGRRSFAPRLESLEDRTVPSTLTVLNNLDSGAGSLRAAITSAKSGDAIVFAPGLDGQTIKLTSGELAIKKSLDIEGPGADKLAVSGGDKNRVFDITSEGLTVKIAGLTITHGRAGGNNAGGGVLNTGSNLTLADDLLSNNVAFGNAGFPNIKNSLPVGGAVRNRNNAMLTASRCMFVANQAIGRDDGGNAWGGPIANDLGCTAVVAGSTFTANRAVGGDGGRSTNPQPIIGHGEGGGIANFGTLTVVNSTFTANEAIGGNGGGSDTNAAYTIDVGNGGGIENFPFGSVLFVDGCTFAYNRAVGGSNATGSPSGQGRLGNGSGGGVKNESVATITNSIFDHNDAIGGDGNIAASGDVLVGVGQGGAINNGTVAFPAMLTASNLTITNNRAIGGNGNTGTVAFIGGSWGGGLSIRDGSTITLSNSTIANNQALGGVGPVVGDGAVGLGGGLANLLGSTLTVSGCTLSGNQATGGAGGVGAGGGNGFGGGAYNDGQSSLTVTGSSVTDNTATGGAAGSGGTAGLGEGGGLYLAAGGVACLDAFTQAHVTSNHASTSNDDVFGVFTSCP